ncbi:hypothetical protein Ccar_15540 [Clostridium carboxidivorans P7]|uniref:Uncharacterized protein n=1 Tax=Clostridium carboxidivorans P7 TaxID=536227 RepID=C6Q2N1_9CLOT|nr:hypothetical protein [Clostridium carboxidivorans]AKN32195.1 hypothetical protein Ccar_15540 [Clostridium carboxidivorans P7]EET84252.1 conserved hypothetical protein [Clostridium carboxidivorans P7]
MRLNVLNLIQIVFLFICISSIFSYIIYSYKKYTKHIYIDICSALNTKAVKYIEKLHIEDYSAFEKYNIWRFCVHFKNIVSLKLIF